MHIYQLKTNNGQAKNCFRNFFNALRLNTARPAGLHMWNAHISVKDE